MIDPFIYISKLSKWVGEILTHLLPDSVLKEVLEHWIYDFTKITLILFITFTLFHNIKKIKYFSFITELLKRKDIVGIATGIFIGIFTPVCSCSVTPIYASLINKGASKQSSSAFLFTAPAINEFALALCFTTLGFYGAFVYLCLGITCGIFTGFIGGKWTIYDNLDCCEIKKELSFFEELKLFFKKLIIPLAIGAFVASLLEKLYKAPMFLISEYKDSILLPFIATIIGLPLDVSAMNAGPIIVPLYETGIGFGTIISLLMAMTVASIPEYIILSKMIGHKSTIKLFFYYACYCVIIGYTLNLIF